MTKRISLLDIIFWFALIVLIVWIILKALGYINSPAIVEAIPYISGVFIAGTIWQQFRNMQSDISDIKRVSFRWLKVEHEHNLMMDGKLKESKH